MKFLRRQVKQRYCIASPDGQPVGFRPGGHIVNRPQVLHDALPLLVSIQRWEEWVICTPQHPPGSFSFRRLDSISRQGGLHAEVCVCIGVSFSATDDSGHEFEFFWAVGHRIEPQLPQVPPYIVFQSIRNYGVMRYTR